MHTLELLTGHGGVALEYKDSYYQIQSVDEALHLQVLLKESQKPLPTEVACTGFASLIDGKIISLFSFQGDILETFELQALNQFEDNINPRKLTKSPEAYFTNGSHKDNWLEVGAQLISKHATEVELELFLPKGQSSEDKQIDVISNEKVIHTVVLQRGKKQSITLSPSLKDTYNSYIFHTSEEPNHSTDMRSLAFLLLSLHIT